MKHIACKLSLLMLCLCFAGISANALPYKGAVKKVAPRAKAELERCRRAQGSAELSINNVRARINQGGNMWYDGSTAAYYVPKEGSSTAMFCAALWIGGLDENDQLRVAALRFGQAGDDFWPGPLTVDGNASVNKSVCDEWDKIYSITKAEVQAFVASFEYDATGNVIGYDPELLTDAIRTWPAHGNTDLGQSKFLAPYYDQNKNGVYEPESGDYPYYDFDGVLCPAKIKANLPAGSTYTPTPTMESDTINPNYGTGGNPATGGLLVDQVLKGDQTLWWIFNDKGNAHTESGSENPIGLEIRAQAFAFTMNNEINNMTFYSYEIINRSTFTLTNTYFSQWVDPDLGYAADDYVGCDVKRGLGYCYNGTSSDGPGTGAYTGTPPAIGIDFFQGPYMDPDGRDNPKIDETTFIQNYPELVAQYTDPGTGMLNPILLADDAEKFIDCWYPASKDSVDACAINGVNFGNGIVDDERFGMRRFVYYNNSSASNGEPDKATDYYNYLRGIWKDGSRMKYGGNGYNTGINDAIVADFMFPGNSDVWGWGTRTNGHEDYGKTNVWSETTAGNAPGDRRFMQSAGPFTLKPGAINYITVGIPFAQATNGDQNYSVEILRSVDDKCQALFDNCFNVLEGPDAPRIVVQELDREIILYLTNEDGNNVNEAFKAMDESIQREDAYGVEYDRYYRFEGYQIFQLKDESVSIADIYDNSKARLVAQCDIENYDSLQNNKPIGQLINYTTDESTGLFNSQVMVDGANAGIRHTFKVTEDKFAETTDKRVVNNKKYYFIAVAYAYNNYKSYDPQDASKIDGQKEPYLASRKMGDGSAIESVVAIPHRTESEQNGTIVRATYGVSPEIIRLEGNGNGGMILNLQASSVEKLMGAAGSYPVNESNETVAYKNLLETPVYQENYGPLNIKVVDPLNVKAGNYKIKLIPATGSTDINDCRWVITNADETQPLFDDVYAIESERSISAINEQIVFDLGLSVSLTNVKSIAKPIFLKGTSVLGGDLNYGSYLTSDIVYKDATQSWLSGFVDDDGTAATNWIRSGSSLPSGAETAKEDSLCDYYYNIKDTIVTLVNGVYDTNFVSTNYPIDQRAEYENCVYGTWAPYRLVSFASNHPGFVPTYYYDDMNDNPISWDDARNSSVVPSFVWNDMNGLASVDIVFTSDTTKWTRCPVIEMGDDPTLTEGGVRKFSLRKHASVDKNGIDDGDGEGMGWFPGYAINLETGERLNMMFGENSTLGQYNGRDMIWNPTSAGNGTSFGGMHYVYVLGTNSHQFRFNGTYSTVAAPRYDEGAWARTKLAPLTTTDQGMTGSAVRSAEELFSSVMWTGMPTTNIFASGNSSVAISEKSPLLIPTDAIVQIRVRKPYMTFWNGASEGPSAPANDNYPMYQFSIESDLATLVGNRATAESALDNITVVPNPYYAYSLYEKDQIENLVKITNLPPECYITIYAVDGTVVRKLRGPSSTLVSGHGTALTSVDWDLKNERGLQISGGVYLIHVKADGVGEKLIKWFGALRPVDLNSFQ